MKHKVPVYSQYLDVKDEDWQERSCGIVSLKMVMEHLGVDEVDLDALIEEGLKNNAYLEGIGWKHAELAKVARQKGFYAENFDWNSDSLKDAFDRLKEFFPEAPVITSVFKNFDPSKNSGHLVVLTGMKGDVIFYNDPDSKKKEDIRRQINKEKFLSGWKRRMIFIEPK